MNVTSKLNQEVLLLEEALKRHDGRWSTESIEIEEAATKQYVLTPYKDFFSTNPNVSIPLGWIPIVDEMCNEICYVTQDDSFKFAQIKEKFGGLRAYFVYKDAEKYPETAKAIRSIVSRYESLSTNACQYCGEKGHSRDNMGWILTACDKHFRMVER